MKHILLALLFACSFAHAQTSNQSMTVLPSAAYTATTVNSGAINNTSWKGGHVIVNISAFTGGTYTPHVQAQDPVSLVWYDILVGTALGATGTTILKVYPGIGVIANGSASDILPLTWRVQMIGASTPNMTFSVSAYLER